MTQFKATLLFGITYQLMNIRHKKARRAYLALCLQPPAKCDALLELSSGWRRTVRTAEGILWNLWPSNQNVDSSRCPHRHQLIVDVDECRSHCSHTSVLTQQQRRGPHSFREQNVKHSYNVIRKWTPFPHFEGLFIMRGWRCLSLYLWCMNVNSKIVCNLSIVM